MHIKPQRRPAILAAGFEAIKQTDHGGAGIRFGRRAGAKLHQRIRLFRPGTEHAARPVIFEAACHQPHAIGEQGRSQRIAGMTNISFAIEAKMQHGSAVDDTADGQPM